MRATCLVYRSFVIFYLTRFGNSLAIYFYFVFQEPRFDIRDRSRASADTGANRGKKRLNRTRLDGDRIIIINCC